MQNQLVSHRSGSSLLARRLIALAAVATLTGLAQQSQAATYVYSDPGTANDSDIWSDGEDWTGAVPPVRGSDTTLQFGGTIATPLNWNTSGVVVTSDNELGAGLLNANGRFDLNQFVMSYRGPSSGTAPQMTVQGGAFEFVADGSTAPGMSLRANATAANTTGSKIILTVSNNIHVGTPTFTINSETNFGGGSSAGNVRLTGTFNWTTTGLHTLNFGGTGGPGNSLGGRAVFAANIADSDPAPGNATTLTKSGSSFWDLTGAVTHTGGTTVNGGTLRATQATGLGTGDITVANGGQVYLAGGGAYANNFFIAGNGPSTNLGTVGAVSGAIQIVGGSTSGLITLQGDARISTTNGSNTGTPVTTINSKITGGFAMTFGNGAGVNQGPLVISGANDYTGGTTFLGENRTLGGSNSGALQTFRLGASEVIPHGVNAGNVLMSYGDQSSQTLDLNGFSETINGLNSAGNGRPATRIIRNGVVGTSVLTLGSNNANGSFLGNMVDGSATAKLALTKIGGGTQTLTGTSGFTADTTVTGGTLAIDYNVWATSQTSTPANYFTTGSNLVLNGGTFAINGRRDGAATSQVVTGAITQRVFTVAGGTANLAVGQLVDGVGSAGVAAGTYILRIEPDGVSISLSANSTTANPTIVTSATTGTTSQTLMKFDLAASSTLDFGTTGGVFLTFANPPTQSGINTMLTIDNWSGNAVNGGGTDQLRFTGDPDAPGSFADVFDTSNVTFTGFGTGYNIVDKFVSDGYYEVIPVPEPTALAVLALGGLGLLARSRRRA